MNTHTRLRVTFHCVMVFVLALLLSCGGKPESDDDKVPEKLKIEEMRDSTRLDSAEVEDEPDADSAEETGETDSD